MARFARHAASANELLDQLASADGVPQRAGDPFPVRDLPEDRRANALRAFLARNAVAMPSEARLAEMVRQLWGARDDARVRIDHAGVSLVRFKGEVHIERNLDTAGPWRVNWELESAVDLGGERGIIEFEEVTGEGIAADSVEGGEWYFAPRSGGESMRLGGLERPTRTLKNLFQELEVAHLAAGKVAVAVPRRAPGVGPGHRNRRRIRLRARPDGLPAGLEGSRESAAVLE